MVYVFLSWVATAPQPIGEAYRLAFERTDAGIETYGIDEVAGVLGSQAKALAITVLALAVGTIPISIATMLRLVHIMAVTLLIALPLLVTRYVLAVVPTVLHKEDSLAARVVLMAMFGPVFRVTWGTWM